MPSFRILSDIVVFDCIPFPTMRLLPGIRPRNLNSGVDRRHNAKGERIGGKMNSLNEK